MGMGRGDRNGGIRVTDGGGLRVTGGLGKEGKWTVVEGDRNIADKGVCRVWSSGDAGEIGGLKYVHGSVGPLGKLSPGRPPELS